jgi:hypothetical protein
VKSFFENIKDNPKLCETVIKNSEAILSENHPNKSAAIWEVVWEAKNTPKLGAMLTKLVVDALVEFFKDIFEKFGEVFQAGHKDKVMIERLSQENQLGLK